ncbi:hypothetical protein HS1genome_0887 [Sulfodiicoccus acidiphilus]|uniref:Putative peptidoglycan binding domain-containing protein n=1 Tax=Sulfodiicoccus acidiphilus TaxID=1670455 RepID=A0A348B2U6_9CREN|nr:DUF1028 domain-containing protein [Sulfodiicoccus acidiphilus]BBD72498.1 hypothetical protein HS1genome_0887 [Sulfodiicoccus acidiphilus]GGT96693.1 hypothetical protein GCM10007116_12730 [Sulfodiicoccus acidiphilus]
MTYSVVAYDPELKAWGVGVASKFLAVGAVVPWLKVGVGALATQAFANVRYGEKGLELLRKMNAESVVKSLTADDPMRERRQLGVVDSKGKAFAFTGKECHTYAGHIVGEGFAVQGNILVGSEVLEVMARRMERRGKFHRKILEALEAAESKGGDRRGKQSAALKVVAEGTGNFLIEAGIYVDIRVDDSTDPLPELRRVLELWEATFLEDEMVDLSAYQQEIAEGLKKLGVRDFRTWIEMNNFEAKYDGRKVGKTVLKVFLRSCCGKELNESP